MQSLLRHDTEFNITTHLVRDCNLELKRTTVEAVLVLGKCKALLVPCHVTMDVRVEVCVVMMECCSYSYVRLYFRRVSVHVR